MHLRICTIKAEMVQTLWSCYVCVIQRVDYARVVFTKRQVLYIMSHVDLKDTHTKVWINKGKLSYFNGLSVSSQVVP